MDKEIFVGGEGLISGFLSSGKKVTTLREVLKRLRETYCGTIGVEYMHIQERDQCDWIRERFETPDKYSFSKEERTRILDRLAWADLYDDSSTPCTRQSASDWMAARPSSPASRPSLTPRPAWGSTA